VHRDPHVVDHRDDVFDLLGLDQAVGQVVVDLGVGKEALLLAAGDQLTNLRLLFVVHGADGVDEK